jgi:phage shock protein PspC (stress-responsive transcriptional regulator)
MADQKRLYKTSDGAVLGGVCKGFAEVYNWDVSVVRLVYVLLTFFVVGSPIIIYIILYIVLPQKQDVIKSINKDALSDDYTINEDEYKY